MSNVQKSEIGETILEKIKVTGLTKIFGKKIPKSIALLDQGKSKEEILKETGSTVQILLSMKASSLSLWDFQGVENQR